MANSNKAVSQGRFTDEDIVISGISGRFPDCDTVAEFQEKLHAGVDLVRENDSRWPIGFLGTYPRIGAIKDLRNFDATFFAAHPKLAERTDPIVRVLLETSVEAIVDAGISPTTIRGSETGVIVAVSSNEAADWWSADPDRINGYEFLGCTRTMYCNRISFALDLKGPSYTLDSQSSGGLVGVQQAYYMLKNGMVDACIVAGVNLVMNPHFNIMFQKLNMLSPDGKCKIFDSQANGYARSDAGVAILMQRASDAKRVYATVVGADTSCDGFKDYGCQSPSIDSQIQLYKGVYDKFNINPLDISFIEAHGYGTKEGDAIELNGITEVFCKDRKTALPVGSVKSNMGHSEPAGGLVSLVKVILAMESNIIPPNLHYNKPNPDIPALIDGRIKVIDNLTVYDGGLVAINSFGIGGTNSHVILKPHNKNKPATTSELPIPRLLVASGRTEAAATSLLNKIESLQGDNEFCGLVYDIFSHHIPYYNYRTFSINSAEKVSEESVYTGGARPVVFVFSGMGSQWPGMCKDLLQLDVFKKSIDECSKVLEKVGFDLYKVLQNNDKNVFENVLNSFVGITSIQIAFVNTLRELGIKPDFIIGHSIGELGCAYADETLTLEQTVLTTYLRGQSLLANNIPAGSMASIGLSVEQAKGRVPSDITIACHNSADNVTISGPPQSVANFVRLLQQEGIFAREVNSSNFAFHSKYISAAGPSFKSNLQKVIPNPKKRSSKWLSTSVPEDQWESSAATHSSVQYHLNNLLSPVLFQEALKHVPDQSVVIEISPHALLQPLLKAGLGSKCTHVGLVRRNQASVVNFLTSVGRLYNAGLQPLVGNLYPPVSYPVSRKTPMIQSLLEWDHSEKWLLITFLSKPPCLQGEVQIVVDIRREQYKFLSDYTTDGSNVFPVSGYLNLIREAAAEMQLTSADKVALVIENFQLLRQCPLNKEVPLKFEINILEKNGECEIRENGVIVARAFVKIPENPSNEFSNLSDASSSYGDDDYLPLRSTDVYQDLFTKGYQYKDQFRGIEFINNTGEYGTLAWKNNFTVFIENLLQVQLLRYKNEPYSVIKHIEKVIINPLQQLQVVNSFNGEGIPVNVYPVVDVVKSAGVEVRGVKFTKVVLRTKQPKPTIQYYTFVPHITDQVTSSKKAIFTAVQITCENSASNLKVAEIIASGQTTSQMKDIASVVDLEPYTTIEEKIYSLNSNFKSDDVEYINKYSDLNNSDEKYDLIATSNSEFNLTNLQEITNKLSLTGFVLLREAIKKSIPESTSLYPLGLKIVAQLPTEDFNYVLLRKVPEWKTPLEIKVKKNSFNWIEDVKNALERYRIDNSDTVVISQTEDPVGFMGFFKSVKREKNNEGLRCLITDSSIQAYSAWNLSYIDYFRNGLVFNVHKNGQWGSYRHFPVDNDVLIDTEHAIVSATQIGDLSSINYVEGKIPFIKNQISDSYELCYVYYCTLYAFDTITQTGVLPYDEFGELPGHEFSGRNSSGKRIFGIVPGAGLATTTYVDKSLLWEIPNNWTLLQASNISRKYAAGYYALILKGELKKGESVYIHAGPNGVVVASINIALSVGAKVFVGLNNKAQKSQLNAILPQLKDENIILLDESNFEDELLERTNGNGVDVIFDTLNCLKRNEFVDSLAVNGRLIEIEKTAAFNESLGQSYTEKNITFHKLSHKTLWQEEAAKNDREILHQLVADGIKNGVVKPMDTTVYTEQQFEEAFKAAKTPLSGKVVVQIREEENAKEVIVPKTKIVKAYPKGYLDPISSYIVTGALSQIGIALVNWLISKGANNLVLQTRYNPVTGYQSLAVRRWKESGANIIISNVDGTQAAEKLITQANSLASVAGIFHLATVSSESSVSASKLAHYELIWKHKVQLAVDLDNLSRKLCPALKYFVSFSSVASLHGIAGQANIAYANSALESIIENRRANDYPATVVQWGQLEISEEADLLPGFVAQKLSNSLELLPQLLNQPYPVVSAAVIGNKSAKDKTAGDLLANKIADVLEINNVDQVSSLTLQELGVEPVSMSRIQSILQNAGKNISESELLSITLNKITSVISNN